MGSDGIVARLPRPERLLEGGELAVAVVALPEFLAGGPVEALDPAVELGRTRRQDVEGDLAILAAALEPGHECRAAIE
jgi:hypothetical protein